MQIKLIPLQGVSEKNHPLYWLQQKDKQLPAVYHQKNSFADHKPGGTTLLPSN